MRELDAYEGLSLIIEDLIHEYNALVQSQAQKGNGNNYHLSQMKEQINRLLEIRNIVSGGYPEYVGI